MVLITTVSYYYKAISQTGNNEIIKRPRYYLIFFINYLFYIIEESKLCNFADDNF